MKNLQFIIFTVLLFSSSCLLAQEGGGTITISDLEKILEERRGQRGSENNTSNDGKTDSNSNRNNSGGNDQSAPRPIDNNSSSNNLSGEWSNLINSAIADAVYVIRQEYVIVKNGQRYGKGSDNFFGYKNGIGVSSGGKLYCSPTLLRPWESDVSFTSRKQRESIDGELLDLKIRRLNNGNFDNQRASTTGVASVGYYKLDYLPNGIGSVNGSQESEGFLIVYYTNSNDANGSIDKQVITVNPYWRSNESEVNIPNLGGKIIGGIYIRHLEIKY